MKRLYSLPATLLLTLLVVPSLAAQTPVAHVDPPASEESTATDGRGASRQILSGGVRTAAQAMRSTDAPAQPEVPQPAVAPTTVDTVSDAPGRSKSMGVGFLATLPSAGLSAIINLTPNSAAQGFLGMFLGGYKSVQARYLHYFRETTNFQPFIFGEIGAWAYQQQTVLGFGGGGGLEYFIERYPFMSFTLEFTMREIGFNKTDVYDVSGLAVGGGVHYYF